MNQMTTEEKQRRAGNYASMMASEAWQDLVAYAEAERVDSVKRVDDKSAADLNLNSVCEERGIRKGMMKLLQHADFCRQGV